MSDLELYTNEELVAELMRRVTFAGFVVWSGQDVRGTGYHSEWQLAYQNLELSQVQEILQTVCELNENTDPD